MCTFALMNWIRASGILGFVGVALGAFGAHELRNRLSPEMLSVWHTGVLYHLLHALVLLGLSLFAKVSGADIRWGACFFVIGIALFSGSLYALALTGIRPLGAITPFGGTAFLIGWGWIAICLSKRA